MAFLDEDTAGKRGDLPSWIPGELYVIALSISSELLAFTAVGLIAAWGEWWPPSSSPTTGVAAPRDPVRRR